MSTTVLLVDDHELIRQGLRRAFERSADFEVVGEAGSIAEKYHFLVIASFPAASPTASASSRP